MQQREASLSVLSLNSDQADTCLFQENLRDLLAQLVGIEI